MSRPGILKRPKRKVKPGDSITVRDTQTALATIRHDVATGNLDHARMVMGRIMQEPEPGAFARSSPAQLLGWCDCVEEVMVEMTGKEATS